MKRVLPGAKFFEMSPADPIFHCFFEITTLDNFPQAYTSGKAVFRGVYEDNDPKKRLLMIVNYNTDVSQYLGVVGPRAAARSTTRTKPTSSASTT